MLSAKPLRAGAGHGIELEYMIVDAATLDVRPVADELLRRAAGTDTEEVELGPLAWSNELALHVVEFKTNGPVASLAGLGAVFQGHVGRAEALLAPMGARLMPTAMHPWMDPGRELRLWPHEHNPIYAAFDRIFGCRGHGWANLQSAHLNLSFADDDEFGRLHAAIRVLLPIIPALAASSPLADGRPTGLLDTRLEVYRGNARAVPSVTGRVIPERVWTRSAYENELLARIYEDLRPHDPAGVLRHEWVNARGCIARFDRMAIEIRLLDLQECPAADLALAATLSAVVRALVEGRWGGGAAQRALGEQELEAILLECIREGDQALIADQRFLACLGRPGDAPRRARDLWIELAQESLAADPARAEWEPLLRLYADEGCLARRMAGALGPAPSRNRQAAVYRRLCEGLSAGTPFRTRA